MRGGVRGHKTCVWQSVPSGDGAIYQDKSTTPKRMTMNDANKATLFLMSQLKGQLWNRFCGHHCNLTTLLDLCTDDKTAQREGYRKMHRTENKGHRSTLLKHVFNTGRDKGQAKNPWSKHESRGRADQQHRKGTNKRLRRNSDRSVKHTAEGSRTSQTHQRADVLNTDHKDVAVFRESSRFITQANALVASTLKQLMTFWRTCS